MQPEATCGVAPTSEFRVCNWIGRQLFSSRRHLNLPLHHWAPKNPHELSKATLGPCAQLRATSEKIALPQQLHLHDQPTCRSVAPGNTPDKNLEDSLLSRLPVRMQSTFSFPSCPPIWTFLRDVGGHRWSVCQPNNHGVCPIEGNFQHYRNCMTQ